MDIPDHLYNVIPSSIIHIHCITWQHLKSTVAGQSIAKAACGMVSVFVSWHCNQIIKWVTMVLSLMMSERLVGSDHGRKEGCTLKGRTNFKEWESSSWNQAFALQEMSSCGRQPSASTMWPSNPNLASKGKIGYHTKIMMIMDDASKFTILGEWLP